MTGRFANIIVDISHEKVDRPFQYKIPDRMQGSLDVGMSVRIPFGMGNKLIKGYVMEITDVPNYDVTKLKEIDSIVEGGVSAKADSLRLAWWIKENYGSTMIAALKTVLPVKQKMKQVIKKTIYSKVSSEEALRLSEEFERKHQTAKARLMRELAVSDTLPQLLVTGKLGVTTQTIQSLEKAQLLEVTQESVYRNPVKMKETTQSKKQLSEEQQRIVTEIFDEFSMGIRDSYLLHGVTGSGKTEVYMELIERIIGEGKQAIVLIPEIALTYQTLFRFYQRFGDRVSVMNSKLSAGERSDQFERASRGEIDIMIGPRSALFTPFERLGLIIIDEEHESSYKSETLPRYHARETAIERARMCGASVVLGSATPSVESYYKAKKGEYQLLELKQRVAEKELPSCQVVDLREELKAGNRSILSIQLQELMEDRLAKKQQIMLFLNRRGVSGFVSCRACGHVLKCPHCDVSLSQHNNGRMMCHYCGYEEPEAKVCPSCGSKYISGFKAGTQKIEAIVKERFPMARVLRMDFDTTRNKDDYEQILSAFANQEADILIGTQMIVKGHDFPNVTLVGILAADLSLYVSDYRASERTFQLLTQAAGRAGRGVEPGEVVIQTYQPEHFSILTAKEQDYEAFYEQEIAYRTMLRYPPIYHMLVILCASKSEQTAADSADEIAEFLRQKETRLATGSHAERVYLVGPADAAVAKVNDIYKKVIYLRAADYGRLVQIKDSVESYVKDKASYKNTIIQFDFNPMNGF